jgi:hypothetical protein
MGPGAAAVPRPLSLPERLLGVFFSPGALGEELRERPRWTIPLLLATVLATGASSFLYFTPRGRALFLEEMRRNAQATGASAQGVEIIEKHYGVTAAAGTAGALCFTPLLLVAVAGVLMLVVTVFMGAELRFSHHLAIACHGYLIIAIGTAVNMGLILAKGSMRSSLSPAAFFPHLPMHSTVYVALALVDFFVVWWLLATGVMASRAGRVSTAGVIAALLAAYVIVVGVPTVAFAALSGGGS